MTTLFSRMCWKYHSMWNVSSKARGVVQENMQTKDNYSVFISMQTEINPPVSFSDVIIQNTNNMHGCNAGDRRDDWSFPTTV